VLLSLEKKDLLSRINQIYYLRLTLQRFKITIIYNGYKKVDNEKLLKMSSLIGSSLEQVFECSIKFCNV
jgi:hypothetical protein